MNALTWPICWRSPAVSCAAEPAGHRRRDHHGLGHAPATWWPNTAGSAMRSSPARSRSRRPPGAQRAVRRRDRLERGRRQRHAGHADRRHHAALDLLVLAISRWAARRREPLAVRAFATGMARSRWGCCWPPAGCWPSRSCVPEQHLGRAGRDRGDGRDMLKTRFQPDLAGGAGRRGRRAGRDLSQSARGGGRAARRARRPPARAGRPSPDRATAGISTSAPPSSLRTTLHCQRHVRPAVADSISTGVPPAAEASTITGPRWPTRASTCGAARFGGFLDAAQRLLHAGTVAQHAHRRRGAGRRARSVSEAITTARLPVIPRKGARSSWVST